MRPTTSITPLRAHINPQPVCLCVYVSTARLVRICKCMRDQTIRPRLVTFKSAHIRLHQYRSCRRRYCFIFVSVKAVITTALNIKCVFILCLFFPPHSNFSFYRLCELKFVRLCKTLNTTVTAKKTLKRV